MLHTAYVHREAYRLHEHMTGLIGEIEDPRERLLAGLTTSMRLVRESPALSGWFATADSPIGAEITAKAELIAIADAVAAMQGANSSSGPPPVNMCARGETAGLQVGVTLGMAAQSHSTAASNPADDRR